jgi:hypothetical protein
MWQVNMSRLEPLSRTTQFSRFLEHKSAQLDLIGTCFHKTADPEGMLRSNLGALKVWSLEANDVLFVILNHLQTLS